MDPLDYLRLVRERWWLVATVLVLAIGAAYVTLPSGGVTASQPLATSYTATHTLLQAPDAQTSVNLELTRLFATTGEIPRKAAERLGEPPENGPLLATSVQVSVDPAVSSMRFTVVNSDGERAAAVANAFAAEVQASLRASAEADRAAEAASLQAQLDGLQSRVLALQEQLTVEGPNTPLLQAQSQALTSSYQIAFSRLQDIQGQGPATAALTTLEEATPVPVLATGSPVPTSRRGRLGLAALMGLLLGVGLVLAIDRLDTRIRTREQAEEASRLSVVAEVPRLTRPQRSRQEVITATAPGSAVAEAYRALRSSLLLIPSRPVPVGDEPQPFNIQDWRPPQVVLVTSAAPNAGKTSTVVNLAATLAESGRSVIVLDADFRKPAAHVHLGVPRSAGLCELLSGGDAEDVYAALQDTSVPGVRMMTSGTSTRHPAALLSRLGMVVDEARRLADMVIIDSAPLLIANDATDIVPHVDTVLVVAHASKTTRPQVERTSELLARLAVPVLGVILQGSREAAGVADSYDTYDASGRGVSARLGSARVALRARTPQPGLATTSQPAAPAAAAVRKKAVITPHSRKGEATASSAARVPPPTPPEERP